MSPASRLVIVVAAALLGSSNPARAQVQFTDVNTAAGLGEATYFAGSGHSLGPNWIDYDDDGWPDLFLVNGLNLGSYGHLYHNNGDGTFTNVDELLPWMPVTEMSSSVFADIDNDGDSDIYVFVDNPSFYLFFENDPDGPPNLLLRNLWIENGQRIVPGQPLFEEVATAAGVDDLADPPLGPLPGRRSKTGGFVDYDRDGCVDLYVAHTVVNAGGDPANRDRLFRNNCDGTFSDVTVSSGVNPGTDADSYRPALDFIGAHLDDDLWPDLYVVNMKDASPYHHDLIYRNNGDGTFTEVSGGGIGDDCEAGMGIDVGDVDNDGDWDVYISDLFFTTLDAEPLGNVFYLGNGDGTFQDNTAPAAGVASGDSWGVNFLDVDHDGDQDLFVAGLDPGVSFFYVNDGDGTFTDVSSTAGVSTGVSRGSALADYDGDGDLDIAVVDTTGSLHLFRNDTANTGNWLKVRLKAAGGTNRDGIGTVIKATTGSTTMMRQITGGSSGHGQNSLVAHFGVGPSATVDQVEVLWPSGAVDTRVDVVANTTLTIVEDDGDADGVTSADDCAPADAAVWSAPGAVTDLVAGGSAVTLLDWSPPEQPGASAPTYDLLRGTSGQMLGAACLLDAHADTTATDGDLPAGVYYYVVRVRNACGSNGGVDSNATPRALPACGS